MPINPVLARTANHPNQRTRRSWLNLFFTAFLFLALTVLTPGPVMAAGISLRPTLTSPPMVGQNAEIRLEINSAAPITDGVVDLEIYDSSGTRVYQKFFDHQNLEANRSYSYSTLWQPSAQNNYRLKIGVFASNWQQLLEWNDNALDLTPGNPSNAPADTYLTAEPASLTANRKAVLKLTAKPSRQLDQAIIDLEIYLSGNRIYQQFLTGQNLKPGTDNNYSFDWTPETSGEYQAKIGIFTANWSSLYSWNDKALNLSVAANPVVASPTPTSSSLSPAPFSS